GLIDGSNGTAAGIGGKHCTVKYCGIYGHAQTGCRGVNSREWGSLTCRQGVGCCDNQREGCDELCNGRQPRLLTPDEF
ncbi:MAG: hypothetical protein ACK48Y_17935, partial [Planctomyces sp.]